jgi:serine-type D-Ala-D-Ala carboxypeptidase
MHSSSHPRRIWCCALVALAVAAPALLTSACAGAGMAPATTAGGPPAALVPPANDNLTSERVVALSDSVRRILIQALRDSAFPGAYAVVGNHSGVLAAYGVGRLDWAPSPPPDDDTLWDLASLTKVVGLTTAMMQLVETGVVSLDAPVRRYLPEWSGPGKARVTVRHLLTHSSGLPAWRALRDQATGPAEALALVYATPLDTLPGSRMVYSDLGAIILGRLVERASGERLDLYLERRVFAPLAMRSTGFRPDSSQRERIAPTEYDSVRGRLVRGEVHDENASLLGGVSAHAGLFSTAHDLTRFARMYLNGGELDCARIVSPAMIAEFTRVQDARLSHRALGWETPTGANSAGHRISGRAFGHTGFTGTSLWIDPARDAFVLLLSNRVNPTRDNRRIVTVRVRLADAVMAALGEPSAASASPPTPPVGPSARTSSPSTVQLQ